MKPWPFPYIVIATYNKNKLIQFQDLFGQELSLAVKGLHDFDSLPEIVEDQDSFEGNAVKKARTVAEAIEGPVIADDSGLVVPALGGAPGVYSARYAGENATDEQNNQKLINEIRSLPEQERNAYYVCAMALVVPAQTTLVVRGECHGRVVEEGRGTEGFGYDPIFYLPEEGATMAELPAERRYAISHRAKATKKLIALMKNEFQF
mgnify:CR=1 FL=1